ncbi:hypothetical protein ACWEPC_27315 [Nonomuraea sp. NPDC004297]
MTTILSPAAAENVSTADQIIETLAVYVDAHGGDAGGGHRRTMLLAACLVRLFGIPAHEALDLATTSAFDERVKAASQARDELLDRVYRDRLTAEAWPPDLYLSDAVADVTR